MGFFNRKDKIQTDIQKQVSPINAPIIEALGKLGASYIDLESRKAQADAFSTVSEIYAPIMYTGAAFSNMKVKLYEVGAGGVKGDEISTHSLLDRIAQPNPLNDWKSFLLNYFVNKKVFGNGYVLKYAPSNFPIEKNGVFWVLPSQYTYPTPVAKAFNTYYQGNKLDEFIRGYNFYNPAKLNAVPTWGVEDVMHQKEPNLKYTNNNTDLVRNLLEGMSPLETLSEPISNIKKAYEAQNVILNKRGALGILTPKNSKDSIGAVTLKPKDKQDLQDQFQNYGLGKEQWQYILSNVEMIWQPMSLPIRELMLFEGIESSMIAICNSLNFPILLMNYLKGSTFANLNEVKKSLYQDNVIPEANSFMQAFNNFIGTKDMGVVLEADYSHIPVLQNDLKSEAEKDQITVNTISVIQSEIFEGKIKLEQGLNKLMIILGFTKQQAESMLTNNVNNEDTGIQQ